MAVYVPRQRVLRKLEVRSSVFLGILEALPRLQDAKGRIKTISVEFEKPTHFVYAAVSGPPGSMLYGVSDGGEPPGSAGRPLLELLKGRSLTNCLLLVLRYFGGTKLGLGPLSHAYSDLGKLLISAAELEELRELCEVRLVCGPSSYPRVAEILRRADARVESSDFAENVRLEFLVERTKYAILRAQFENMGKSLISLEVFDHH